MYLMTHHNPLAGISYRVIGIAQTQARAQQALRHYYTGVPSEWEDLTIDDKPAQIRWINKGAGVCYVIQEVEVFE